MRKKKIYELTEYVESVEYVVLLVWKKQTNAPKRENCNGQPVK